MIFCVGILRSAAFDDCSLDCNLDKAADVSAVFVVEVFRDSKFETVVVLSS